MNKISADIVDFHSLPKQNNQTVPNQRNTTKAQT